MTAAAGAHVALALAASPFLLGIINRVKSFFGGRTGQPLLQPYYDIARLLRKGAVYSRTTTWVFRAGPVAGLAAGLTALALLPAGSAAPAVSFAGDFLLFAYLLGVIRSFLVLAALDTGSAFEGMGASREVMISVLAEPALLVGLAAVAKSVGDSSLAGITGGIGTGEWVAAAPVVVPVAAALFAVLLAETARIPVDDPNTHLELTMVHEVMVLDHSGPDLAFIMYTAALKLWLIGAVVLGVLIPAGDLSAWASVGVTLGGMVVIALMIGVTESVMARFRMSRLPVFLAAALTLSVVALLLAFR